jgi:hypothetical protein
MKNRYLDIEGNCAVSGIYIAGSSRRDAVNFDLVTGLSGMVTELSKFVMDSNVAIWMLHRLLRHRLISSQKLAGIKCQRSIRSKVLT